MMLDIHKLWVCHKKFHNILYCYNKWHLLMSLSLLPHNNTFIPNDRVNRGTAIK